MDKKMISNISQYLATQPVLKAWIFGSFSRGEETKNSDVDILFVPDKSQHFSLFTLGGMYEDLKEILGRDVDLIPDGSLLHFARESAERDKILIYERQATGSRPPQVAEGDALAWNRGMQRAASERNPVDIAIRPRAVPEGDSETIET